MAVATAAVAMDGFDLEPFRYAAAVVGGLVLGALLMGALYNRRMREHREMTGEP